MCVPVHEMDRPSVATPSLPEKIGQNRAVPLIKLPWLFSVDEQACSQFRSPSQRVCVVTAPLWTALHGAYSRGVLPDASVYTCSPLGDDGVYPCGRFSFAKYIPGISAPQSRALSLQVFSGARQGWGWWLEVSGWLSFTDGLDRLLSRATHIYHTQFLTKTTGTEGKPLTPTIYNLCPHVWDLTAQMCICHSSIWWSSERWQDSCILFIVPNYEQGNWRRE